MVRPALLLLFTCLICLCHRAPVFGRFFSELQQPPMESIQPRKRHGKGTVRRKPVLAGCLRWAGGYDDRRQRGIPSYLLGKSTSLEQVQSQGPREGVA